MCWMTDVFSISVRCKLTAESVDQTITDHRHDAPLCGVGHMTKLKPQVKGDGHHLDQVKSRAYVTRVVAISL